MKEMRTLMSVWKYRVAVAALLISTSPAWGSPALAGGDRAVSKSQEQKEGHELVELFSAADKGDVEVRLIPKNAKQANIIVTNKSDKPLSIQMPEAFAGVPVLAQGAGVGLGGGAGGLGGGGGFGGNGGFGGGGLGGGGNQGFGGGFGGGGFGGGFGGGGGGFGGGMGGGMFNIAPGKEGKVEVGIVCLEHGKEDPNPKVEYTIKPIESFTEDQKVIELCKLAARSDMPQSVAQAAAWHLTDNLTWDQLRSKIAVQLSNGYTEMYFNQRDIYFAQKAVSVAEQIAKDKASSTTSADSERGNP